ncbi:hypothetical protein [Ligilactobacillus salivarius]|uniref:hypothetical protein n=1 Tax=Ligilactobacillus salivarius TaxID=1624 RepID=UPI000553D063|nr:hypothetical protein [Ligilactobacillus salivarius]
MKKLIYSMEAKNRLNNILATGDALFFAIQLIIIEIHTRLTSQSLLNIKAIVILMVVNLHSVARQESPRLQSWVELSD